MRAIKVIPWALAAMVVLPALPAQAQGDCRNFSNDGRSSYYYEYWDKADKVLSRVLKGETVGNRLTVKEVDDAIVNLRGAISLRATSGKGNY